MTRSAFDQEREEEFRDGLLLRGRGVAALGHGTFGYLATFSNAADRDRGVLAGERLDPGPAGVGSRFRLVVPFLGVRMFLNYEVIRFAPDREVLPDAADGVLQATDRVIVKGTADGSTVSYDTEVRLRGTLRMLAPVPWTREKGPGAAHKLWNHLVAATATDSPKLAQAGRDSVAVEHDIPARGQR